MIKIKLSMSYVKKFYEKKLDNLTFFVYICNNGID